MNPIQWCVVYILGYYGWVCGYCRNTKVNSNPSDSRCAVPHTIKAATMHGFSYYWSGRIRVYKNKPCAVRINTRIHADLSSFDDKSSERFEPRQTTVCRLNMHVPNRKLKPPQMRRFEFSGRSVFNYPKSDTRIPIFRD